MVPNVAVLIEAQQVFELEQALEPLYIKHDDVEGNTVIAPNKDLVKIMSTTALPFFVYSDSAGLARCVSWLNIMENVGFSLSRL